MAKNSYNPNEKYGSTANDTSHVMRDGTQTLSLDLHSVDVTNTDEATSPGGLMMESSPEVAVDNPAPDGGWGWAVVVGSFLCHTLLEGFSRSLGVLFQTTLRMFKGTNAETAVHQSLFNTLRLGLGETCFHN